MCVPDLAALCSPPLSGSPPPPVTDGQPVIENAAAAAAPTLVIDGAALTLPDLFGGRAVVHVIDKVLVAPEAAHQLNVPTTTTAHRHNCSTVQYVKSVDNAGDKKQPLTAVHVVITALTAVIWAGSISTQMHGL